MPTGGASAGGRRADDASHLSQWETREEQEAHAAVCSFIAGFGLDPAERRALVERLMTGAQAHRLAQPDRPLADCALEHAEQAFEAWLAALLGSQHPCDLAVGRAAFLLCGGPALWAEFVLVHDDLPAAFTDAMRSAAPPPTPVPAPSLMATQSLESWSLAQAADLLGVQAILLTDRRAARPAVVEVIDRTP